MFEVSVTGDFSSAHSLRGYQGRCEGLHGHNWHVEITVAAKKLDKIGLAVDFKILKKRLNETLEGLDHKYLNTIAYFKKLNPTSESIAQYLYEKLTIRINNKDSKLKQVTVWESENSRAVFYR